MISENSLTTAYKNSIFIIIIQDFDDDNSAKWNHSYIQEEKTV